MNEKSFSRRDFLRLTTVAAAGGALAACAPSAPEVVEVTRIVEKEGETVIETVVQEVTVAAPPEEMVEITFMGWGGTEEDEGVRAAIAVFEGAEPNIKVTWLHTPDSYNEKMMSMVAANTPPDTAFITSGNFQTFVRDEMLLDVTDMLRADPVVGAENYFIEPQEEQRCTKDGKWYGFGSCWVAPHIYYNADVFEAAGVEPPSNDSEEAWSWDEFLEAARLLTVDSSGNHPGDSGFDIDNVEQWGVHWPTWWIPVHSAIASNEGDWIDWDTGQLILDQPEATEAIQRIADLMLVQQVMPQSTVFEALGMSNTQMLETGKLAMAVDGSWALAWITKIEAALGTAVLPKMKVPATNMQAHLHSGFAATPYPDASWRWLRFLATEFYQLLFCRMGLWLPSQTGLMTEEGLAKWMTLRTAPGEGVHPEGFEKIVTEFVPQYGRVLYMPPGYAKIGSIVDPAFDAVWVGDKTAEEAMAEVVPDANAILAEEAG